MQALVGAGINLLVCNAHKIGDRARVDVVPDDAAAFGEAAAKAGLAFVAARTGFLIQGQDRPGALAENLKLLANAGINVAGIDAMGPGGGWWGAILWIEPEDMTRAGRTLGALQN